MGLGSEGGHPGTWHPWTWEIRPPACKCDRGQHPGGDERTYFSPPTPTARLSLPLLPLLAWFKCILVITSLIRAKAVYIHPPAKNLPLPASLRSRFCSGQRDHESPPALDIPGLIGAPRLLEVQRSKAYLAPTTPALPCLSQALTVHKGIQGLLQPGRRPPGPPLKLRSPGPV